MALIIGTADHRRRIPRRKQRALICRIPRTDPTLRLRRWARLYCQVETNGVAY